MRSKKMFLVKNLFIIVFVAAIYGCSGQASTPDPKNEMLALPAATSSGLSSIEIRHYRTEVESFIDSAFGHRPFNGSILVAKNGEVIFEKYSGFWNPRLKRDSISPSTPFHLASVSKTFTAMAIMKMQEEGKLSISDPVSKYLPGFPLQGVTIKTL